MALMHSFFFTKTLVDWDKIAEATHNQYQVVAVRKYLDKKGKLPDGYILTLMVLKDEFDYGVDTKTGKHRDNNQYINFDVTVLTREHEVKKGDFISLSDFDSDNSYAIGFELLLRFRNFQILKKKV